MAMENEDEEEAPRSPASVIRINDQTHEDVLVPACCRRRHGGHRELAMATVDDPQGPWPWLVHGALRAADGSRPGQGRPHVFDR